MLAIGVPIRPVHPQHQGRGQQGTGGRLLQVTLHDRQARRGRGLSGLGAPRKPLALRNPGTALDLEVVSATRVNRSAAERRAATLPGRRTVKKEWQAAWLLRAISAWTSPRSPATIPPAT
jgi:hypothetical protein